MLIFVAVLVCFAVIWKLYLKLRVKRHGCYSCMTGKTAIITGANAGLGYMTAMDFAMRGARVILACRNKDKAEEAIRKITKETGNANLVYKHLDVSSFTSIRTFAKDINENEKGIHILVNNVGGSGYRDEKTEDGLLSIMQINHFGPFLLTHLLVDKLKEANGSRIVNIASWAASFAKLDVNKINEYPKEGNIAHNDFQLYCDTKLCNMLFTLELSKKLHGTTVTANCLHPGTINTDFFRQFPAYFREPARLIAPLYFKTLDEGIQTHIYVSLSTDLNGVSGKFFDNCQEVEVYKTAQDPDLSRKLWIKSEELVGLSNSEKLK